MPLNFLSVLRRFSKISLSTALILFLASALTAQDAVYFKCRWTGDYIYCQAKQPGQNATSNAYVNLSLAKTLWFIERVDDIWVRLRTKDSLYLHVENGKLDASNVPAAFFSSQWKLPVTDGHNLIINRWTGVYINFEAHDLQASPGQPGWWSAQWSMEDKDGKRLVAKDFSLNAYTSFLPNQQQYYKLENIKYDPTPIYLDINKTKSSELATLVDYGGDNSGKAWKFTLVSDEWYKISNLKLGGNKVLAIAKNTDGSYYFVLTDFANYPNQLWRMIQFRDQTLLNFVTEKKLGAEKFASMYYTLVSKQHGLEPIKALADAGDDPRILNYGFDLSVYLWSPFDITWKVHPVDDISAIKNIPLSQAEQNALVKESVDNATKIFNDAMMKATPIAQSPFKQPVGHVSGQDPTIFGGVGGRDLSTVTGSYQIEYTQKQWDDAIAIAGKIPMFVYNNSNFETAITIYYTDQSGEPIIRTYVPTAQGQHIEFYLDPFCTNISFTGTANSGKVAYRSTKFFRSRGVKIYLDGTSDNVKETIWNW